jgi:hypothetical protein
MAKNRTTKRILHPHAGKAVRKASPGRYAAPWSGSQQEPKNWVGERAFERHSDVPEDLLNRGVLEKLPWIARFVNEGCPYGQLLPYAQLHATANGVDKTPPYTTLNTWVHRYRRHGLLGLMDGVRSHAGESYALGDEGRALVRAAILGGKHSPSAAHKFLLRHWRCVDLPDGETILDETRSRRPPSYNSVRRAYERLRREESHLFAVCFHGEIYYRNVYRLALSQGMLPCGYRYSIDSTVADIWVRVPNPACEEGWEAVRPVLTAVIDVGSRLLLTFGLSLTRIDSGIILGIFQRAVDADYNYPWLPSLAVPHQVSCDKGSEHQAVFRDRMASLGVEILSGLPNEPQGHARVERIIQTITTEVLAGLVGYSPAQEEFDAYAPAERDTKRLLKQLQYDGYHVDVPVRLLPTLPELEAAILAWATIYNARPHPGLPVNSAEFRKLLTLAEAADAARDVEEAA